MLQIDLCTFHRLLSFLSDSNGLIILDKETIATSLDLRYRAAAKDSRNRRNNVKSRI